MIFEYTDLTFGKNSLYRSANKSKGILPFYPINVNVLEKEMTAQGWQAINIININQQYLTWYSDFLIRIITMRDEITLKFGKKAFSSAYACYSKILEEIMLGHLGGSIVYATKPI